MGKWDYNCVSAHVHPGWDHAVYWHLLTKSPIANLMLRIDNSGFGAGSIQPGDLGLQHVVGVVTILAKSKEANNLDIASQVTWLPGK